MLETLFSMLINALLLLIVDKSQIYKLLTNFYRMKHKSKFHNVGSDFPTACGVDIENSTERYHGLSYYLNGGIDLDGDALSKDGDAEYDTEEEANEMLAEGASSVALGDPRQSKFRLVEQFGVQQAQKATSANPKPTATLGEGAEGAK